MSGILSQIVWTTLATLGWVATILTLFEAIMDRRACRRAPVVDENAKLTAQHAVRVESLRALKATVLLFGVVCGLMVSDSVNHNWAFSARSFALSFAAFIVGVISVFDLQHRRTICYRLLDDFRRREYIRAMGAKESAQE